MQSTIHTTQEENGKFIEIDISLSNDHDQLNGNFLTTLTITDKEKNNETIVSLSEFQAELLMNSLKAFIKEAKSYNHFDNKKEFLTDRVLEDVETLGEVFISRIKNEFF